MMKPTERSIPPEMMTSVCPIPRRSGAVAKIRMLFTLKPLNRKEVEKATCAQILKK